MTVTTVDAGPQGNVPLLEFLEPARPRLSGCGHRCFHDELDERFVHRNADGTPFGL